MEQFGSILPLAVMFGILYLLIIRPQMKKQKDHQRMLSELQKGDKVVVGGIVGKITSIPKEKETIKVSIANGVEITAERGSVTKKVEKPGSTSDKK